MRGFLRVWQECDLQDIEKYLIVVGELSSECFACHKVGIDFEDFKKSIGKRDARKLLDI